MYFCRTLWQLILASQKDKFNDSYVKMENE
jgi:hypothetical protein